MTRTNVLQTTFANTGSLPLAAFLKGVLKKRPDLRRNRQLTFNVVDTTSTATITALVAVHPDGAAPLAIYHPTARLRADGHPTAEGAQFTVKLRGEGF